jgi:hypothetical protein
MRRGRYRRRSLPLLGMIAAAGLMGLLAASFLVHHWGVELRVLPSSGGLYSGLAWSPWRSDPDGDRAGPRS